MSLLIAAGQPNQLNKFDLQMFTLHGSRAASDQGLFLISEAIICCLSAAD